MLEEPTDVNEQVLTDEFAPTHYCSLVRENGALEVRECSQRLVLTDNVGWPALFLSE